MKTDSAALRPTIVAETRIDTLFASPVLIGRWADCELMIERIIRAAKAEQAAAPNYTKYLVGGWRSKNDALRLHDAEIFAAFETCVIDAACGLTEAANPGLVMPRTGWRAEIWANISRAGAYHRSHAHRHDGCVWSGVFYADDGLDPGGEESGALILEDRSGVAVPVAEGGSPMQRERHVPARTGRIVIFSPWQFHRVEPYKGARERLSIAFNLFHDGLKIALYPDMAPARPDWRWEYFKGPMLVLSRLRETLRR